MNVPCTSNLLRRTAAALAAVAGFHVAADSQAAQITLSSGTATCTFDRMLVTPAGHLDVQCLNTSPPAASHGGTFRLSATAATFPVSTTGSLSVVRETGNTGAVAVSYSITPNNTTTPSCTPGSGTINFGALSYAADRAIAITTTAVEGACTVTLGNPSTSDAPATMPTLLSVAQATAAITVAPPNTCPTPPTNMIVGDLGPTGDAIQVFAASGVVVSFPLPAALLNRSSGAIKITRGTSNPDGALLEGTVSKCPGVVDPTAGFCYLRAPIPNLNVMNWFYKIPTTLTEAFVKSRYCYAPTGGPWYFNVRWTHPGTNVGGYVFQSGYGPM